MHTKVGPYLWRASAPMSSFLTECLIDFDWWKKVCQCLDTIHIQFSNQRLIDFNGSLLFQGLKLGKLCT